MTNLLTIPAPILSTLRETIANNRERNKKNSTAALITLKGETIAIAGNDVTKSHPLQSRFARIPGETIYLHAEIAAIAKALRRVGIRDLKRATLYIARLKANGEWGNAKPCSGCARAIAAFEVQKVYFTNDFLS